METMTTEELEKMKLHEVVTICDEFVSIMRVPGGWLYAEWNGHIPVIAEPVEPELDTIRPYSRLGPFARYMQRNGDYRNKERKPKPKSKPITTTFVPQTSSGLDQKPAEAAAMPGVTFEYGDGQTIPAEVARLIEELRKEIARGRAENEQIRNQWHIDANDKVEAQRRIDMAMEVNRQCCLENTLAAPAMQRMAEILQNG